MPGAASAALGTYQRALGAAEAAGGPVSPAVGMLHVGTAEVLYERNELDRALPHATEGVALCRQLAHAQSLAMALATLAWIRNATGDPASARQAIAEAARAVPSPDIVSLHNPVPAARARLLLLQGELADAVRWTDERGVSEEDQPSYPRELDYLVLARVLLARDAPDRALSLLAWLQASAVAQRRVGSVITI
jgi:LuxR family maltose regulon positive regulatory protein